MASPQGKAAFAFVKDYLTKKKGAPFAEVAAAAKAKGHKVYPIVYGRAQLLLGHTKAKSGAKKSAGTGRKPGRPKGSKNKVKTGRGPGRPPKAASASLSGIDSIVAHIRSVERERDQLRATLEKLRGLLSGS